MRGDYEGRLAQEDLAACDSTVERIAERLDGMLALGASSPTTVPTAVLTAPTRRSASSRISTGREAAHGEEPLCHRLGRFGEDLPSDPGRSAAISGRGGAFVVAATFTRAAAAEMEKRILEAIEKGEESPADKLRLIMRAARVHFSTIDALFHRFLSTEAYVPQVADDHEKAIITALADERFFSIRAFSPTSKAS